MTAADEGELHLATLTRLWLFPRYLYRVGDKPLASPLNLRVVGWALLLVPAAWLLSSFGPLDATTGAGAGLIPRLIIPGLLIWLITTKVAHGAKPWEAAWSWARFGWHLRRRPKPLHTIVLRAKTRTPMPAYPRSPR